MKKIVGILLLIGTVFFGAIVIKFSSLPVITILPENIQKFWTTSDIHRSNYSLIYDIGVGFLLSTMFYCITTIVPEKIKSDKSKRLISNEINLLMESIEQVISLVCAKYGCPTDFSMLAEKDFFVLDGDVLTATEEISYSTSIYNKRNKRITGVRQFGSLNNIIKSNIARILKNINYIKNYEYFYVGNTELVECIRSLEDSSLIQNYKKKIAPENDIACFLYADSAKQMSQLVDLFLRLKKLNLNTKYSKTKLESFEETVKYREERENGTMIRKIIDNQQVSQNIANANPCLIIHSSKYSSKILVNQIKKRMIVWTYEVDKVQVDKLSEFKYVVCIVDSHSLSIIENICNNIHFDTKIILIVEQNFLKIKPTIKNRCDLPIIQTIFFKCAKQMCKSRLIFFKEEPSKNTIQNIISQLMEIIPH